MNVVSINGQDYRLPGSLTPFQQDLYVHLINWKWLQNIKGAGTAHGHQYDAILPKKYSQQEEWPHLYPEIQEKLKSHLNKNNIRIHTHFYHMASSQAANINLFLPILHHPDVNAILAAVKPDFASLATDYLDHGYCLEFWGGNFDSTSSTSGNSGLLGDKSKMAGTDSDIAIAYRNHEGELCLWLIEHKLSEREFTACGGFKSKGKQPNQHDCSKSFTELQQGPQSCYYHDKCNYKYWEISTCNETFFANHPEHSSCPFRGGMNQLWRNQLLGLAIEQDDIQPYAHVDFSVVRHPGNTSLDGTLTTYKKLIGGNQKFSVLTSAQFVESAEKKADEEMSRWASWYRGLYNLA